MFRSRCATRQQLAAARQQYARPPSFHFPQPLIMVWHAIPTWQVCTGKFALVNSVPSLVS